MDGGSNGGQDCTDVRPIGAKGGTAGANDRKSELENDGERGGNKCRPSGLKGNMGKCSGNGDGNVCVNVFTIGITTGLK